MDPDAVLVCHRCGTEFGLGKAPEGAQPVDTASIKDRQTPDMFADLPPEPTPESDTEPAASDSSDLFPAEPLPEEGVAEPANEPAAESIGQENYPTPDDIPDIEPEPVTPGEQADDPEPVIIPGRDEWPDAEADDADRIVIAGSALDAAESGEEADTDLPAGPPPRAKARIMPWLITVLLLIAGAGFWVNHEAWLNDPWLRSVLINAGVNMEIRDRDWKVDPDSVSAVWIERRGGETVLVITGEVRNLLQTQLLPPLMHVTLYARDNPDEMIAERDEIITRPPLMQAIRQAPYLPPPQDNTPVSALDKRGFVLVLENLPQNAGNFTLQARAR